MLAVQTAEDNLLVRESDIASLTPVYPNRTRVVLADGRVAHRPGPPPPGPWPKLEQSYVSPQHLQRQGDHWKDPADYLYPYQELTQPTEEPEENDLPEGLLTLELQGKDRFWRTDSGLIPCDLDWEQARKIYPQLCQVGRGGLLVNLERIHCFGPRPKGGWVELDNGERFEFGMGLYHDVAHALGTDSLAYLDQNQRELWRKLRDFPYDLTSADPERIRRDLPEPRLFLYNLLYQAILYHHHQIPNDYGRDPVSFALNPLQPAFQRLGYPFTQRDLTQALNRMVYQDGLIQLRELGFLEADPNRRQLGAIRPQVLLISADKKARQQAENHGLSLLLSKFNQDRLPLENLLSQIDGPIHLIHSLPQQHLQSILNTLDHLETPLAGPAVQLENLADLPQALQQLPQPWTATTPDPFRRIPLQANDGLVYADPQDIASWTPVLVDRWQVVLQDGRVLHHLGPVPSGPWVPLGKSWLQPKHLTQMDNQWIDPAQFRYPYQPLTQPTTPEPEPIAAGPALPAPPEQIVSLSGDRWQLLDGRHLTAPPAPDHHPGLVRLGRSLWVHHNRIQFSQTHRPPEYMRLDGGHQVPINRSRFVHQFEKALGVHSLDKLAPDFHGLRLMRLRDYPYEIVNASAAQLQTDFNALEDLISNTLWQAYNLYRSTGKVPYGKTFTGFFYRPLQAILYRAGYLTRAQIRGPMGRDTHKYHLYHLYYRLLFRMVYQHKLFNYRQFGFKDAFPELRILGTDRVHQILLVEKGGQLEEFARRLQAEYGLTMLILKGMPSLLASEYFREALTKIYSGPVEILFLGDYDFAGYDIGPSFRRHLKFYGTECTRLERLVLPCVFTPEEQILYSRPIEVVGASVEGRLRNWLAAGGGINGEARGIHANWLFPYERVKKRLEELL